MVQLSLLLASIALFALSSALPNSNGATRTAKLNSCPTVAVANSSSQASANAKAIYFISNAKNNSVVALRVASDGTLSDGSITLTGGSGMNGIDESTGKDALPDTLFSQGAVKAAGNVLLAVNSGSNTITMFTIDVNDPIKLTMVGQPVSTLGDFPTSVSISQKNKLACVANSGAVAGIACFRTSLRTGLTAMDEAVRPFALNQTTPPKGPLNTVSQTFFSGDEKLLFTTVKGDPNVNNTGFLSIFSVSNGEVSKKETRSSPAGTAVMFGSAVIPDSEDIFVTDAAFGSATIGISAAKIGSVKASTKIADQKATCWVAVSERTGSAFVTDVAVNHLVEVDVATGELIKETNFANGNPGLIDLVAKGNFVYALSPGNESSKTAVVVVDIGGGKASAKEIQNFFPAGGITSSAQGLTFI